MFHRVPSWVGEDAITMPRGSFVNHHPISLIATSRPFAHVSPRKKRGSTGTVPRESNSNHKAILAALLKPSGGIRHRFDCAENARLRDELPSFIRTTTHLCCRTPGNEAKCRSGHTGAHRIPRRRVGIRRRHALPVASSSDVPRFDAASVVTTRTHKAAWRVVTIAGIARVRNEIIQELGTPPVPTRNGFGSVFARNAVVTVYIA